MRIGVSEDQTPEAAQLCGACTRAWSVALWTSAGGASGLGQGAQRSPGVPGRQALCMSARPRGGCYLRLTAEGAAEDSLSSKVKKEDQMLDDLLMAFARTHLEETGILMLREAAGRDGEGAERPRSGRRPSGGRGASGQSDRTPRLGSSPSWLLSRSGPHVSVKQRQQSQSPTSHPSASRSGRAVRQEPTPP